MGTKSIADRHGTTITEKILFQSLNTGVTDNIESICE